MNQRSAARLAGVTAILAMSACVRDGWSYDASVVDVGSEASALDASTDAPTVDGPAAPPRPLAPLSLGGVTQLRPTLRWALSAGHDGAAVELCRDRACRSVIETLTVTGSSARPMRDLPPRSVVFWRLRGRAGGATAAAYGPTWLFHVPATSASTEVDPHADTASVFHGGAAGIPARPAEVYEGGAAGDRWGVSVAMIRPPWRGHAATAQRGRSVARWPPRG